MGRVDRIKRLSYEVLDQHKSKFNENFADNKKLLDELTIIRSKGLKNEIAGYITKFIKTENRNQELKDAQTESVNEEINEISEEPKNISTKNDDTVIEVGVDEAQVSEISEPTEEKNE